MSRRLARTVIVRDTGGTAVAFGPNDDVPDWAVAQITNPDAWGVDDPPGFAQMQRIGATHAELAAVQALWAGMTDEQRADAVEDQADQTDEEMLADLVALRAEAAERGVTVEEALRNALAEIDADEEPSAVVEPPLSPVLEPPPTVDVVEPPQVTVEKPARNGSKAAWLAYAISQGMPEDEAQAKTRDELADLYGG